MYRFEEILKLSGSSLDSRWVPFSISITINSGAEIILIEKALSIKKGPPLNYYSEDLIKSHAMSANGLTLLATSFSLHSYLP